MILLAAALAICPPSGVRSDCVVDGDTVWIGREKVRVAEIDAPELSRPKCEAERLLAIRARDRLLVLLNSEPYRIERTGKDRYGRTLGIISNSRGSIGRQLVAEGLARKWTGRREPWCPTR